MAHVYISQEITTVITVTTVTTFTTVTTVTTDTTVTTVAQAGRQVLGRFQLPSDTLKVFLSKSPTTDRRTDNQASRAACGSYKQKEEKEEGNNP